MFELQVEGLELFLLEKSIPLTLAMYHTKNDSNCLHYTQKRIQGHERFVSHEPD